MGWWILGLLMGAAFTWAVLRYEQQKRVREADDVTMRYADHLRAFGGDGAVASAAMLALAPQPYEAMTQAVDTYLERTGWERVGTDWRPPWGGLPYTKDAAFARQRMDDQMPKVATKVFG